MGWRLDRVDVWWLAALVLLALVVRAAWASYATADPLDGRFSDMVFYHLVGANLAEGGPYTSPYTLLPTAHFPPGYPFFLAGLYWMFGDRLVVAEAANVILGAATVGLLYLLARRLFESRTARMSALLLAVFPGQVFFASLVFSEVLFTFAFLLAIVLMVVARDRVPDGEWYWLVVCGVAIGVAGLIRGAGLSLALVAPVYWALSWRGLPPVRTLAWSALALVLVALVLLPWTLRNYRTMDAFLLLTSTTGFNLWTGHHEGADGSDVPKTASLEDYGPRTRPGGEVDINDEGYRQAWRFVREHPDQELLLIGKRFRWFYLKGDAIAIDINEWHGQRPFLPSALRGVLRPLSDAYYYFVLAIAIVGLVRWRREGGEGPLLPVLIIGLVTFVHIVVLFGSPRYHFPLIPLFCLLAGWTLAWPVAWLQRARA